jgi:hypothetical protein
MANVCAATFSSISTQIERSEDEADRNNIAYSPSSIA